MKRLSVIVSLAVLAFAAPAHAEGRYSIIRWSSGYCQILDASSSWKPFPGDYKTGRRTFKTFAAATVTRAELVSKHICF